MVTTKRKTKRSAVNRLQRVLETFFELGYNREEIFAWLSSSNTRHSRIGMVITSELIDGINEMNNSKLIISMASEWDVNPRVILNVINDIIRVLRQMWLGVHNTQTIGTESHIVQFFDMYMTGLVTKEEFEKNTNPYLIRVKSANDPSTFNSIPYHKYKESNPYLETNNNLVTLRSYEDIVKLGN